MLPKLDRLILKELFPLWAFGVAVFSVLIMAGSFLFEITRFLSEGANIWATLKLVLLLMPGIFAKTFAMAMLLASLLAFGRLSGDSEIVAMQAAGVSIWRIMLPVAIFGLTIGGIAFWFNNSVVPWASFQAFLTKDEIKADLDQKSEQATFRAVYDNGQLQAMVTAKSFDIIERVLTGANLTFFSTEGKPSWYMNADKLIYNGEEDWRIQGAAKLLSADGRNELQLKDGAWPAGLAKPRFTPEDLFFQNVRDLDALSMQQLRAQIERDKRNPQVDKSKVANMEFGYWNKISLPLAAIIFGLVGAPLGIRSHRTSTASGFWMSVIIIFAYMLLTNVMAIIAQGGAIPSVAASFTPIAAGLIAAGVLIKIKNG